MTYLSLFLFPFIGVSFHPQKCHVNKWHEGNMLFPKIDKHLGVFMCPENCSMYVCFVCCRMLVLLAHLAEDQVKMLSSCTCFSVHSDSHSNSFRKFTVQPPFYLEKKYTAKLHICSCLFWTRGSRRASVDDVAQRQCGGSPTTTVALQPPIFSSPFFIL